MIEQNGLIQRRIVGQTLPSVGILQQLDLITVYRTSDENV